MRETMMSQHFLLDWSRDPCQVNRLEIDSIKRQSLLGERRGGRCHFTLSSLRSLNEPGFFMFVTRWSLSGTAFLQAKEYDSGRESYLLFYN